MLTNFMTCSDIKQKNILNKVNIKAKFVSNLQFIHQMQNTYMYDNIVTLRNHHEFEKSVEIHSVLLSIL